MGQLLIWASFQFPSHSIFILHMFYLSSVLKAISFCYPQSISGQVRFFNKIILSFGNIVCGVKSCVWVKIYDIYVLQVYAKGYITHNEKLLNVMGIMEKWDATFALTCVSIPPLRGEGPMAGLP